MKKRRINDLFKSNTFILVIITVVLILIFWVVNKNYLTLGNIQSTLLNVAFDGILVIGEAIVLIGGEVDLASGALACFGGALFAILSNHGVPWVIAMILTLLIGLCCGLLHSFMINELKFMSFMATLAMATVYRGFVALFLGNKNIQVTNRHMQFFGKRVGPFPMSFIIFMILLIGYGIFLSKRTMGRSIYFVGGNRAAARLAGINPKRISYFVYMNNAVLCTMAGIIYTARMHTASPSTGANGETNAITAAVLGGVSFLGGSGSVVGCFVGVMLLDFFNTGLTAIGFPAYWQIVVRGCLLVAALIIDSVSKTRRDKKMVLTT
jgi:ribose transport system permease protein